MQVPGAGGNYPPHLIGWISSSRPLLLKENQPWATKVSAERSDARGFPDSCEEYRCEEYPCSDGDRISESQYQYFAIFDTIGALKSMFADRPDVVVAGNLFVYYREGDPGSGWLLTSW